MAIASVTLKCTVCGKEFEIRKNCFNRSDADSYEEWAKDHIDTCPECKKAARIAAEEDKVGEWKTVELTGSEKQIKWANDLRRECIIALLNYAKPDTDAKRERFQQVVDALNTKTESRWWIDNRDQITDLTWLFPTIKEIMKANA